MTAPVLGPIGNLADHANHYATLGWEIFPVNPADKTPLVSQYQATSDPETVAAWWHRWPTALIGHRIPKDVIVLDIDPRHGGRDTWLALKAVIGELPVTRGHQSGRGDGGGHTWWRRPDDRLTIAPLTEWAREHNVGHPITDANGEPTGRWTSGIDLLHNEHRYTILPPSPHPDTHKPYQWIDGRGPETNPAPLPQLLVDLLTTDTEQIPAPAPRPADPDSIADWYSRTHTWTDLLSRHGWRLVGGDGNSDRSRWRHPTATSAFSATIRHGCLFVYSPNTPLEVTEPGTPRGYTLFRAYATLEHHGDLTAAARAARTAKGYDPPTHSPLDELVATPTTTAPTPAPAAPAASHIPDVVWDARPHLTHIRQAAHSRQRSADAVLHVILARISAITPHTVTIPPIVGAPAPLSYFSLIIAPPGVGKSSANQIATELLPAPTWVRDQLPLGSGEGLAETLFDLVETTDDNGKTKHTKKQVRHNGFIYADEGQTLADIGSRSGSTLLSTIRTIWSGGNLGQTNASTERSRIVPAGSYVFGACIALQPTRAGALLADVDAGTPQRFGWASATDPTIPDNPPDWPGPLNWEPPPRIAIGTPLDIHPDIAAEIRAQDLARARGQIVADPLDAHEGLYRLKVAGLLAILDERTDINLEDWALAEYIKHASDQVRTHTADIVAYEAAQTERQTTQRLARRHTEAQAAEERRRIVDGARKLADRVHQHPDGIAVSELRRGPMRRWAQILEDVIEHATAEGWVSERKEPTSGNPKRVLAPGEVRP